MFGIGPMELMAILVVALLVFGPKRIPELAQTLGRGLAEFRRASNDLRQSLALDELQRDLRKDLDPNQTIHRPSDRPAQAGADLGPPDRDDAESPDAVPPTTNASDRPESSASRGRHPGELPTGAEHDYEHRDAGDGDAASERGPAAPVAATGEPAADPEPADPPAVQHANRPADPELGNVPVSGGKPTDPRRG